MPAFRARAYEFGPYRLDPHGRSLERGGAVIPLPPKAVQVLLELVRQPGMVVSKQDLMNTVWHETFVEEANLNQMMFLLRRALTDVGEREYIVTVPRRGYRFTSEVRTVEILSPIESIAVLPLANLTGDPAQEYFADGITEALITELAKLGSLRVVSRTSVMRYKNTKEPVVQIGRALRVQALVEGSVMKSGDRVWITAQLIHPVTDQHLWAATYDCVISEIIGVQSRVARDIATSVRGELSRDEEIRLAVTRTVHPEAYSLYLKGRFFERNLTAEGQTKAIRCFRESIDTDPNYAAPYAALAQCFIEMAYFFGMEPKKAFKEAEPAAVKAVELDESFADGHAVLALVRLFNDWDWATAEAESRRAIELAPGDPFVYWKRGVYLQYAGRSAEAVAAHRQAESLDPFSLVAIEEVGWPLYYARRFDEAAEQFRRVVELAPEWDQGHWGLGMTLVQQENEDEAITALRTAAQLSPGNALLQASLVYGLGRAGRRREATEALQQLNEAHAYVPCWFSSLVWIGLNDKDRAFESLEGAFRDHEPCLVTLKVDPVFDPLRGESRFAEMVRRVGLEP